jgi:Spx/MgsR family transcriptional regulator
VKAKQLLGQLGIPYQARLFFEEKPTVAEVESIVRRLPDGVFDLVSVRGNRYKELCLAERDLTESEWIALLAEEPRLWRRPVIVTPKGVQVGFNADAIKALLSE